MLYTDFSAPRTWKLHKYLHSSPCIVLQRLHQRYTNIPTDGSTSLPVLITDVLPHNRDESVMPV